MSSLADLPNNLLKRNLVRNDINTGESDNEFDALLEDMLDSPVMKPSRSTRTKSSNYGKSAIKYEESLDDEFDKKLQNNSMDDSNDLSADYSGNLGNTTAGTDDLEDSILGGLLKGKKKGTNSKQALKPEIAASSSSKAGSNRNSKIKETWGSSIPESSRRNNDFHSLNQSWNDGDNNHDLLNEDTKKNSRSDEWNSTAPPDHQVTEKDKNSFKPSYQEQGDDDIEDFEENSHQPSGYEPTLSKNHLPLPRPPAALHPSYPHSGGDSSPKVKGITKDPEKGKDKDEENTDVVDIGFVPSFLEPGRQMRQKRNIGGTASTNRFSGGGAEGTLKENNHFDELDFALGLGSKKGNIGDGSAAVGSKAIDPFLNAGSNMANRRQTSRGGLGLQKNYVDSSDSDDDTLPKKTNTLTSLSVPIPILSSPPIASSHHRFLESSPREKSPRESLPLSSVISGALPSLVKSPSYQPQSPTGGKKQVVEESEDELYVGGIVRKQSFEEYSSTNDIKTETNNRSKSQKDLWVETRLSSPRGNTTSFGHDSTSEMLKRVSSPPVPVPSRRDKDKVTGSFDSPKGVLGFDSINALNVSQKSPTYVLPSSESLGGAGISYQSSPYQTAMQGELSLKSAGTQIKHLQNSLEEAQLQKEALERHMRVEIDSLKLKLHGNITSADSQFVDDGRANMGSIMSQMTDMHKEHEKERTRFLDEMDTLRRKSGQLEGELARLNDEALIQALKHKEEIKYMQDRRSSELSDVERRKEEDVRFIERRHTEAISALKKIHIDELTAVKERARDGVALDQLAGQLKTASGSIKLMEEHLNVRYKGLDAAKDGQLEARERILSEMEAKAKDRVEAAEIESYRLKGLLVHMEHVASGLRSGGAEEKERLRQEHQRCESMQSLIQSEREAHQKETAQEGAALRQKGRDMEMEGRRLQDERRIQLENDANDRRKLEADRADFAVHVAGSARAAETGIYQLKEEESRLKRIKDDLTAQITAFEKKRQSAMSDILESEKIMVATATAKDELGRERAQLQRHAQDLQGASERLALKGEGLNTLQRGISERESALRDGLNQMHSAAQNLSRRESDLNESTRVMEQQRHALDETDRVLTNKRIQAAAAHRALTSQQAAATVGLLMSPSHRSPAHWEKGYGEQKQQGKYNAIGQRSINDHHQSNQYNIKHGLQQQTIIPSTDANPQSSLQDLGSVLRGNDSITSRLEKQQKALQDHAMTSAKQVLENVRGQLSRSQGAKLEMNNFIAEETAFLTAKQLRNSLQ